MKYHPLDALLHSIAPWISTWNRQPKRISLIRDHPSGTLTSVTLQLSPVAKAAPIGCRTAFVARSRPPPDSEMAELMSEVTSGNELMMKTLVAPADWPNNMTFFCWLSVLHLDHPSLFLPDHLQTLRCWFGSIVIPP